MIIGITGSRGFIGRNLAKHLTDLSIRFIELDDIQTASESNLKVDHIIHLASKTSVQESWDNIPSYIEHNVQSTAYILELARTAKASVSICSSYGINASNREPGCAPSPYHLTKLFCESLCSFYYKNFDVPIAVLKLANVYGVGQKSSFLVPTIIEQVTNPSIPEVLVNTFSTRRNFIDVRDVIEFIMLSLPREKSYKTYYVGPSISHSVQDVVQMALKIARVEKPYRQKFLHRKNELEVDLSSLSETLHRIDWKPKYTLEEGLKYLIDRKR